MAVGYVHQAKYVETASLQHIGLELCTSYRAGVCVNTIYGDL